jgi:hypothetical protein
MKIKESGAAMNQFYSLGVIRFIRSIQFILLFCLVSSLNALDKDSYISSSAGKGKFTLSTLGKSAPILISSHDYPGVARVAKLFQNDVKAVTNALPGLFFDVIPKANEIVIVGTIGKNSFIDQLIKEKKINVDEVADKWDAYLIQVVEEPLPNVERALVVAGSNKRGTIFGMFDISYKIGVSPWYWWADVPVKKQQNIFVNPGRYTQGEPKVKYRGIFINDEAPALSGLTAEKFGGFNSKFYDHVFELILRMKGNFLWPAMWGNAFYDDDPENPRLADEYGVVISTSHHEPMMRAHDEWRRYGKSGKWSYEKNDSSLRDFWRDGIKRMGSNESVVTIAMRGDGDEAMSADANVSLLQKIVTDQRKIISEVTGKDASQVPQVWALYKEVQDYYDKGMRVPDDVTLLLCDDNWGNIRKLPKLTDVPRSGGYGIYYHYDYVGGPRNYKWLNTNQISRVWEQMHLAYEYGAKQIWIVNVGDIKPMEFPIEFFLDYAWNPEKISSENLNEYTIVWAEKQFGNKYAKEIAYILDKYTQYNSRRKPELLAPETYSLANYKEAETVIEDYNKLVVMADKINNLLPAEYKDSFFQLVLHPVTACANMNELYLVTAKNRLYAKQGRSSANSFADRVKTLFTKDSLISYTYNKLIANGKWNHMMDQTHIGYTYWQQPDKNTIPKTERVNLQEAADMGVAIEGSTNWWPLEKSEALLPEFDNYQQQKYYIDIFNRGKTQFDFSVKIDQPWIKISELSGKVEIEKRIWLSVDWKKAPKGKNPVSITISGTNKHVVVQAVVNNPETPKRDAVNGFVESNGYISIDAENFSRAIGNENFSWNVIPNLGRTGSAVTSFPVTLSVESLDEKSPHLEYNLYLFSKGEVSIKSYLSTTLNFIGNSAGLRYAISIDDEKPQIINMTTNPNPADLNRDGIWNKWVGDNINIQVSKHVIKSQGNHTLKFWRLDPGIIIQKIIIDTGGLKPSYLGPQQSYNRAIKIVAGEKQ